MMDRAEVYRRVLLEGDPAGGAVHGRARPRRTLSNRRDSVLSLRRVTLLHLNESHVDDPIKDWLFGVRRALKETRGFWGSRDRARGTNEGQVRGA